MVKNGSYVLEQIQQKVENSKLHVSGLAVFWDGMFSFWVREEAIQV